MYSERKRRKICLSIVRHSTYSFSSVYTNLVAKMKKMKRNNRKDRIVILKVNMTYSMQAENTEELMIKASVFHYP